MASFKQKEIDEFYMKIAIDLANIGTSTTSPNPKVGCVIVRDGKIIGQGSHLIFGEAHAEVNALINAKNDIKNSTVYITLEPCSHQGKTPACAKMLIEKNVSRVVVGMIDPNPMVNTQGLKMLQKKGIDVTTGILEKECRWLNRGFLRSIKLKRPWVTIKVAMSIDGKIALSDGSSKWITTATSRQKVHILRSENDAILTGVGTILADNPELTVRLVQGNSPIKVIIDRELKTPLEANIFKEGKILIFTSKKAPIKKIKQFKSRGVCIEIIDSSPENQIKLILNKLCEYGINYLLVEAGAKITSAFLSAKLVDEVSLFISPKFMGKGLSFTEHLLISDMSQSIRLKEVEYHNIGEDILLEGVLECSPEL
ncbi:MAG: bifunctional diaminohydroxyphosphoribosylaminopyrimidine deaminase/5-amino-6-(5-phosphoribosylamino)uracil reductase RibD [Synergistaceae bacterium]|jgi:diaminohydroxyphosphoribosylaminopyrimidine deaminase/5-amino-6-(5-phosphoribosylamino)uracil reductase|nr:bifunctional diaminohydroxyphosphoribosylaminopyrimidine deaminase/5-amino-6-(5-phosphoribosylamino)uracil reductase RibD [Synergistaceae bacterium]